jgi:hypothetical protein
VDAVCENPHVKAISFVGGDRVGKYIYEHGSANGKRVQSNMVSGRDHQSLYPWVTYSDPWVAGTIMLSRHDPWATGTIVLRYLGHRHHCVQIPGRQALRSLGHRHHHAQFPG